MTHPKPKLRLQLKRSEKFNPDHYYPNVCENFTFLPSQALREGCMCMSTQVLMSTHDPATI